MIQERTGGVRYTWTLLNAETRIQERQETEGAHGLNLMLEL
jgi:hypothetical protein